MTREAHRGEHDGPSDLHHSQLSRSWFEQRLPNRISVVDREEDVDLEYMRYTDGGVLT